MVISRPKLVGCTFPQLTRQIIFHCNLIKCLRLRLNLRKRLVYPRCRLNHTIEPHSTLSLSLEFSSSRRHYKIFTRPLEYFVASFFSEVASKGDALQSYFFNTSYTLTPPLVKAGIGARRERISVPVMPSSVMTWVIPYWRM